MEHYFIIFGIYLIRWQLSTPILSIVPILYRKLLKKEKLSNKDLWSAIIIANVIGALIFFAPDCILLHH